MESARYTNTNKQTNKQTHSLIRMYQPTPTHTTQHAHTNTHTHTHTHKQTHTLTICTQLLGCTNPPPTHTTQHAQTNKHTHTHTSKTFTVQLQYLLYINNYKLTISTSHIHGLGKSSLDHSNRHPSSITPKSEPSKWDQTCSIIQQKV